MKTRLTIAALFAISMVALIAQQNQPPFMRPEIVGHFLAGMQYILGDLEASATPNPLK